jgi:UDP-glucose 4-epimerase
MSQLTPADGLLPTDARVLVTGATGFIGSHLVRRLVADGVGVHALTSAVSSVYPFRLVDIRDRITLHSGSLSDRSAMDAVVEDVRPTHVFHLGAYTHVGKSWQRVDECVEVNVQGTVNLLQALDGSGCERIVNIGTSEIYGDVASPFREDLPVRPVSPYAASKYAAECFCRVFQQGRGWPIVMIRPFNAYGPAQTADRIIPEGIDGQLFNLGCGEDVSIRDVTTLVLDLLGNPVEAHFGALPERPTEIWEMRCDNTRAREILGWKPQHSLAEGLKKTIEWYRHELQDDSSPFVAE